MKPHILLALTALVVVFVYIAGYIADLIRQRVVGKWFDSLVQKYVSRRFESWSKGRIM